MTLVMTKPNPRYSFFGRPELALAEIQMAIRLSPYADTWFYSAMGEALRLHDLGPGVAHRVLSSNRFSRSTASCSSVMDTA